MEQKHHPTLSPSSFPALIACPCYKNDGEESDASKRGTRMHEALAEAFSPNETGKPNFHFDEKGMSPDMVEDVSWAMHEINSIIPKGPPIEIETRVSVIGENFEEITFGSADIICGGLLIDLKTGEERDYRPQMEAYALGIMQKTGLGQVCVVLIYSKSRKSVQFLITKAEAEAIVSQVAQAVADPNKKPSPCDYCGWCASVAECPALTERAQAVAKGREDWALVQYHSSKIAEPAEMSKALELAKLLSKWCEAVEHMATDMVLSGKPIPGFKLKERSGNRNVVDIDGLFQAVGIPADKFLSACSVSLTKLEEVSGLKKSDFDLTVESYTERGASSFSLAKEKKKKEKKK